MRAGASLFASGANAPPDGPDVADATFVFVTGSELPVAYTQVIRRVRGRTFPQRVSLLASAASENAITREDEHTLRIEPEGGFLRSSMDRVTRYPRGGFSAGQTISRPDFDVRVSRLTRDGRPASATFRFRRTLDDPSLIWLAFVDGEAIPFELPPIGGTVLVKPGLLRI